MTIISMSQMTVISITLMTIISIALIVQNLTHYASMRTSWNCREEPVSLHLQDSTEQSCDTGGVAHAMDLPHEQ
jgi:hypothetical protein